MIGSLTVLPFPKQATSTPEPTPEPEHEPEHTPRAVAFRDDPLESTLDATLFDSALESTLESTQANPTLDSTLFDSTQPDTAQSAQAETEPRTIYILPPLPRTDELAHQDLQLLTIGVIIAGTVLCSVVLHALLTRA